MTASPSALESVRRYNALVKERSFEKAFKELVNEQDGSPINDEAKEARRIYYKQYQRQDAANAKWKKQNREVILYPSSEVAELAVELYLDRLRVEGGQEQ